MKKNKIFVNKIDGRINNNQKSFDINNSSINDVKKNNEYNELTVNEKIDKLLNRNGYVFNVNVKIITDKKEYQTRIAGKVNNHLITLDNDVININDIEDIIIID